MAWPCFCINLLLVHINHRQSIQYEYGEGRDLDDTTRVRLKSTLPVGVTASKWQGRSSSRNSLKSRTRVQSTLCAHTPGGTRYGSFTGSFITHLP